jgi:photosystem II stability/assembly factor-like uncharacterized protein
MRTRVLFPSLLFLLVGAALGQTLGQASGPWVLEKSGTTAGLRGIHAVGDGPPHRAGRDGDRGVGVAWASGTNGTVLRTEDGGYEWQSCAMPPGAEKLDFRGVWAWDTNTAILMSSGTGDASRLYKTTDGCSSWKLVVTNNENDGFWDSIAMWTPTDGFLGGDPVDGHPFLGEVTHYGYPSGFTDNALYGLAARKGDGAFAASNSCLWLGPFRTGDGQSRDVWFATGGESGSRVIHYRHFNGGEPERVSTDVINVPLFPKTQAGGIFSIASTGDEQHFVAVGGDYTKPNETAGTAAWSSDGGKTWTAAAKPPHGFRSAVAWDADLKAWIAAGTNGSDISWDDGKTWEPLDDGNWNALSLPWVVGPGGRIAKLDAGRVKKP